MKDWEIQLHSNQDHLEIAEQEFHLKVNLLLKLLQYRSVHHRVNNKLIENYQKTFHQWSIILQTQFAEDCWDYSDCLWCYHMYGYLPVHNRQEFSPGTCNCSIPAIQNPIRLYESAELCQSRQRHSLQYQNIINVNEEKLPAWKCRMAMQGK